MGPQMFCINCDATGGEDAGIPYIHVQAGDLPLAALGILFQIKVGKLQIINGDYHEHAANIELFLGAIISIDEVELGTEVSLPFRFNEIVVNKIVEGGLNPWA